MTAHSNQLYPIEFTEADQARLVGFSCGDESWSRSAKEWVVGSDVFNSIKKGTRVWLFELENREIVGFGSIGLARWNWPPPRGPKTNLVLIPMLAIDQQYHGQQVDPEWRYSRQIMSHLLAEAHGILIEWADRDGQPEWLVLYVHRDNHRAIRFYHQCGFELIEGERNDHRTMRLWIAD